MTPAADEVWQTYLIPQMFGKYIRSGDLESVIRETESALERIYGKWQAKAPESFLVA